MLLKISGHHTEGSIVGVGKFLPSSKECELD